MKCRRSSVILHQSSILTFGQLPTDQLPTIMSMSISPYYTLSLPDAQTGNGRIEPEDGGGI